MKLSKRLTTIFDMFSGEVAADVGSDHGKLIISLFESGKIKKGYAIENKSGPFSRLSKEIEGHGLLEKVIPMFSDGISELPNDVDSVIIAGMGGHLIVNILESHPERLTNVNRIFVDAHNGLERVRNDISKLGYHIIDEEIIYEEDIYYEIIAFEKGEGEPLTSLEKEFGPILLKKKSPIFFQKYSEKLAEIDTILENNKLPFKRKQMLKDEKKRIEKVL